MDNRWVSGEELKALYAAAQEAQLRAIEALAAFDQHKAWDLDGAGSAASWLVANCNATRSEAERAVASARVLGRHDEIREAAVARTMTPTHLAQLAQLARHRSAKFTEFVPTLVEAATTLDSEAFRTVTRRWRAYADDTLAPDERDTPCWLEVRQTFRGSWHLEGIFDPARGTAIANAIADLAAPRSADDRRPATERRADALYEAMFGDQRVHAQVDVVIDLATLAVPADALTDPATLTTSRRDLVDYGPVTQQIFERLACDARIRRVIMHGESEVLDVGRTSRLASPAQRRAIARRDGHCVWPGCDRPAPMCDVHHLIAWHRGGPTDLANLALVCGHHHQRVHDGWKLQRLDDGCWDVAPP